MINLKACSRCGGDLIPEELLDDIDLVCLQCGHRTPAAISQATERTFIRVARGRLQQRQAA
jgi:DNA-directed RNA polymerase subunit M/transcription elongation factor TFIIS